MTRAMGSGDGEKRETGGTIRAISRILNQEVRWFERLLHLLLEQKDLIIENDIEAFKRNLRDQEECIAGIQRLEKRRIEKIDILGEILEIPIQELNLSKIIDMAMEEYRSGLMDLQRELKKVVREVGNTARTNSFLMDKALLYIQKNFDILVKLSQAYEMYDGEARKGKDDARTMIVNRKV